MTALLRIANAHGFWGDRVDAAAELLAQEPSLDYLTFDFLAEISLSIMAIQKKKDPLDGGYAHDFVDIIRSLAPFWSQGSKVKVIANGGGLNPLGCAHACAKVLKAHCTRPLKIGVVTGDDVTPLLRQDPSNPQYRNLDTQESLQTVLPHLTAANVYLGAAPLVKALLQGADIVITGRITDPSLVVAPCVAHFGWGWTDYDRLAGATVAGHLIECGAQATGGISSHWLEEIHDVDLGFPFVEISLDGTFTLTKSPQAKGIVTEDIIKEQLLYEIGDPSAFLGPDVTVSIMGLALQTGGPHRVFVEGARGAPPPELLKVSASYEAGFKAEAFLTIVGREAEKKGKICAESILARLKRKNQAPETFYAECLGRGDASLGILSPGGSISECVLRMGASDRNKEKIEYFSKEIAPLVTSGPPGITGYTSGRPSVRHMFGYWPCLIERGRIHPQVEILEVTPCP